MAKYYESEATQFIRSLLQQRPELVEKQRQARATWWDKQLDLDEQRRFREAKLATPSYAYYDKP
jgi:hypothetical protein